MISLLMTVGMIFPQGAVTTRKPAEKPDLNGSWTVVCYERDGKPVEEAKNTSVTIKDNQISFVSKDGTTKIKTMKCEFGKPGHIRVTETDAISTTDERSASDEKAVEGVVVVTKAYLAVCLHDEAGARGQDASASPSMKSKCTVILKREGAEK